MFVGGRAGAGNIHVDFTDSFRQYGMNGNLPDPTVAAYLFTTIGRMLAQASEQIGAMSLPLDNAAATYAPLYLDGNIPFPNISSLSVSADQSNLTNENAGCIADAVNTLDHHLSRFSFSATMNIMREPGISSSRLFLQRVIPALSSLTYLEIDSR